MIRSPEALRYFLLNKPRSVMTTCDDPEGRPTVLDIVRPLVRERVYPVGRLDYHSEGLLILTNDGNFAEKVAHPRHGVVREYLVKVRGDLKDDEHRKLMAGTVVDGSRVKPRSARCESKRRGGSSSWWRIEVTEGRTHEVRELFFHVGHPVQRLRRTAIGSLRDDTLKAGEFRTLTRGEIQDLRKASSKGRRGGGGRASHRRKPGSRDRRSTRPKKQS
jgi:23S rRNA pseudouridine2605 synthase